MHTLGGCTLANPVLSMLDGQDFTSSQSLRISLSELTMSYGQFCVSNRDSWRRLALAVKSAWQQK